MLRLSRPATVCLLLALASRVHAQSCFEPAQSTLVGPGLDGLISADLDGDGDQDLVVLRSDGLSVFWNQGTGTFSAPVHCDMSDFPGGVVAADVTGDGLLDLVASGLGPGAGLFVFVNLGSGSFAPPVVYPGPAGRLTLADLDGDGDLDAATFGNGSLAIRFNQGAGVFGAPTTLFLGASSFGRIASGDLDGDGDVDLVVALTSLDRVDVLLNPGNGVFANPVPYVVGDHPSSIVLADLDGDGDLDLASAQELPGFQVTGTLAVLLNQGGTFGSMVVYACGHHPLALSCADLDGDGDLDLAVANFSDDRVKVFLNQGLGMFLDSGDYDTNDGPIGIVAADLDGDGDMDLATTNANGSDVSLLRNCSAHWTGFCPGDGSAGACPCANYGSAGRGCNNSAATGGARLVAAGEASLAHDTLVLLATGELDFVSSIVLQGSAAIAPVAFGDGLRCAGGSLKRLYLYDAFGGDVSAPLQGDASISARSALLGDAIPAGATRYYQVYYRDPLLGFCAAPQGNSWNVSSAVSVLWTQ